MSGQNIVVNNKASDLTEYPSGSLRELWKISFPLMLSTLAVSVMIFLDRIVLAHYCLDAMNAAATAGTIFFSINFGAIAISAIAEVFVGQHNGAKRYHLIGQPVWQMIWFSLFLIIPYFLIGLFGDVWLVPENLVEHAAPFLRWLFFLGPSIPLVAALSAFFIARGKVHVVTFTVATGCLVNLCLDLLLVFGVKGFIPPLGTKGAAIATGMAHIFIASVLFSKFIARQNREKYKTHLFAFNKKVFTQCLKIGAPSAIGRIFEISAWAFIMAMLANTTLMHISMFTIAQTIWILFCFIHDGLCKGVTAICSNLIGANSGDQIKKVFFSAMKLLLIISLVMSIPLLGFKSNIVQNLLPNNLSAEDLLTLQSLAQAGCLWIWLGFSFDGIMWILAGILTAAGDTRFIMFMSSIGAWTFGIVPIYIFVIRANGAPLLALILPAGYNLAMALCFLWRYKSGRWQQASALA